MITQYWPQIVMILMFGIHIGIFAVNHRKPRTNETYNIAHAFARVIFLSIILYFGGFFKLQ